MRIAIAGICHETSTFTPLRTERSDFDTGFGFYRREELLTHFEGSNTVIGGIIEGARNDRVEIVPLLWTFPYPGGLVSRAAYEDIRDELSALLDELGPFDAVILDQHGSMVVEHVEDADGD